MDFMFHGQRIRETTEMTSITRAREVFEKRKQGLKDCAAGITSIKKTQPALFATAAQEFVALAKGKKRKWAPRMLEIQKNSVAHLLPVFGKKLLLGIEGKHIAAYQEQRTLEGASGRTVNIEVATLRAILKRHKQWERLQDDVVMLEGGRERSIDGMQSLPHEQSDIGHALTAGSPVVALRLSVHSEQWENSEMGSTENLKPWQPGQSGNPGGRPRTKLITAELERMLEQEAPAANGKTWAAVIAEALLKKARKGDVRAIAELANRIEGKARQTVDLELDVCTGLADRLAAARKRVAER
jgi:hypothetical protein